MTVESEWPPEGLCVDLPGNPTGVPSITGTLPTFLLPFRKITTTDTTQATANVGMTISKISPRVDILAETETSRIKT